MIKIKGHIFENDGRSVCSRCHRAVRYNHPPIMVNYGLIFKGWIFRASSSNRRCITERMISEKNLIDCNDLLFEQLLK